MPVEQEKPLSILAYTDGTKQSIDAVRSGLRLAVATGGALDIIHATDIPVETEISEDSPHIGEPVPRESWPELPQGLHHLALDVLDWIVEENLCPEPEELEIRHYGTGLRRIRLEESKIPIRLWLAYTSPNEALTTLVKENESDLVIIRGEETSLLKRLLGHNLAEAVAINLPTNILVIRGAVYPNTPFVIASDGSESSQRTFGILRKLLPAIENPIDMIVKENADTQNLQTWLASHNLKGNVMTHESAENEHATTPLNQIIEKIPENCVLVLGASMRNFILRTFTSSLPLALVRSAPFSVLISKELPDKADEEI